MPTKKYDKRKAKNWEIANLGIVTWEVALGKIPNKKKYVFFSSIVSHLNVFLTESFSCFHFNFFLLCLIKVCELIMKSCIMQKLEK